MCMLLHPVVLLEIYPMEISRNMVKLLFIFVNTGKKTFKNKILVKYIINFHRLNY